MAHLINRIYPLDTISQARIRSSVRVLSLNEVAIELLKNSLDAQAHTIEIVLNYSHGFCSVEDDGNGIPAEEFRKNGRLAQAYCTSKAGSRAHNYGKHGQYLAALAGVSLLCITSRSRDAEPYTIWQDETGRLTQPIGATESLSPKTSTRVKVYNLFSKLPVRRKQLSERFSSSVEVHKEFEALKYRIVSFVLAFNRSFEVVVQHSSSTCKFHFKPMSSQILTTAHANVSEWLIHACSALRQARFVGQLRYTDWQELAIQSDEIQIRAVLSLKPMPHKSVQFISIHNLPLTKQMFPDIYQLINTWFENSSFGSLNKVSDNFSCPLEDPEDFKRLSTKQKEDLAKGVDRWPMFVICIELGASTADVLLQKVEITEKSHELLSRITSLLEPMIKEFLLNYGFVQPRRVRVSEPAAEATSLDVTNGAETKLQQLRPPNSRQSFRHWSRVKSSQGSVVDNILTGLPSQDRQHEWRDMPRRICELKVLYACSPGLDSEATLKNEGSPLPTSATPTSGQSTVLWTNPHTGRSVQIDARTGMVVPQTTKFTQGTRLEDMQLTDKPPFGHQSRRSKPANSRPVEQDVQSIKRHTTDSPRGGGRPIRSIATFNINVENVENVEERVCTPKKRFDTFWKATAHPGFRTLLEAPAISKIGLRRAKVIQQVDNKFILVMVPTWLTSSAEHIHRDSQLVLIDQHAADERCKVEHLLRSVVADPPVVLAAPLRFEFSFTEARLLSRSKSYFRQWQIHYEVLGRPASGELVDDLDAEAQQQQVSIIALPSAISERCRLKPKFIIDILREEIWSDRIGRPSEQIPSDARQHQINDYWPMANAGTNKSKLNIANVPPRLLDMISSRACRSAIMFNDELTIEQCEQLVAQVSKCTLPFQCAHGRPSMVVLSDLGNFPTNEPLAFDMSSQLMATDAHISARVRTCSTSTSALDVQATPSYISDARATSHNDATYAPDHDLNTVDTSNAPSFGNAYHSWIATDIRDVYSTAAGLERSTPA